MSVFLFSFTSAALGIGFPGEVNQEKNTELESTLTLFTFGEDKTDVGVLEIIEGAECATLDKNTVDFDSQGIAYTKVKTKSEGCDGKRVKIQLSPAGTTASTGTVGMNLAVVKSFVIKSVSTTSTVAIITIAALVLVVLLLVAAMVKVAKKRN